MSTIEQILSLTTVDLATDLIAEYATFKECTFNQAKEIIENAALTTLDPNGATDDFYKNSDDFLINLIRVQNRLPHLTGRVSFVVQTLAQKQGLVY